MSPTVRLICGVWFACFLSASGVSVIAADQKSEDKAVLQQTHAERWLEANRASLSQRQIELVIEAISFLAADRQNSQSGTYGDELKRRLTCELGRARVTAAFTFLDPPRQSFANSVDEWLAWFPDCFLRGNN